MIGRQPSDWLIWNGGVLEGQRRGRAALLARAIAGDAEFGFRLCGDCRMSNQACKDGLSGWWNKRIAMNHRNRCRTIRALLGGCLELRIVARTLTALRQAHHAMMLAVPSAAGRQILLRAWRECQQRRENRQAKEGQQQNGESFAHGSIESHWPHFTKCWPDCQKMKSGY